MNRKLICAKVSNARSIGGNPAVSTADDTE
jgi:hypothetical protein